MFNAAMHAEEIQDARDYGLDITLNSPFDWSGIKGKLGTFYFIMIISIKSIITQLKKDEKI